MTSTTITSNQRRLLALCAIRIDHQSVDWSLIAREAQFAEGLDHLWNGRIQERSAIADASRGVLRQGISRPDELFERVDAEMAAAEGVGASLVTVLEDGYPATLRMIPNLPPFLFVRGDLREEDARSVAVVGTRDASEAGVRRAQRMSRLLTTRGVTVVSGLARGIDTAAHRAALDSRGRTIAVLGTGITKCYPAENRSLADEIAVHGAVVSQFWPTRSPGRDTFPRRNVVTSGLSQGTVVIEASSTSGAKMQARLALEHGKKVFLVRSLVTEQSWAKTYVNKRGAIEIDDVDDVMRHVASPDSIRRASEQRQQLTLSLL
jgi:DNA processing protein